MGKYIVVSCCDEHGCTNAEMTKVLDALSKDSADAAADTLNLTATKICPKCGSTMGYFAVDMDK